MKRIFYTLSFVSVLLLASCQKTDIKINEEACDPETIEELAFNALKSKLQRLGLSTKATGLSLTDLNPVYANGTKAEEDDPAAFAVNFNSGGFSVIVINNDDDETKAKKKATSTAVVAAVTTSGSINTTSGSTAVVATISSDNSAETADQAPAATQPKTFVPDDDCYFIDLDVAYLTELIHNAIDKGLPDVYEKGHDYGPYLKTHWTQLDPFNWLVPNKYSGCVILALMQLMVYNEKPEPKVFYSDYKEGEYGNSWKDFLPVQTTKIVHLTTADWRKIETRASQIAYQLAIDCNAHYESYGTWSTPKDALNTLKKYGYNAVLKKGCNKADMKNIDEMIMAGKPVFFSGECSKGGHAWVIDGLSDDMYHINWGWGGQNDGWFTKGVFDSSRFIELDPDNPGAAYDNNFTQYFRYILY